MSSRLLKDTTGQFYIWEGSNFYVIKKFLPQGFELYDPVSRGKDGRLTRTIFVINCVKETFDRLMAERKELTRG